MTSILKGAIYCRVSTDEQETHGSSLQSQKLSCIKFASENKLTVPEEYIFLEQYSGGFLDRPQLTHLLLLASKGLIDFVIFTKRDRVARDQYVFQKIMKDLQDNNVKVYYSEEKLTGDKAMDSFMGSTIIGFAAWEREQIKLRTNIGKRQFAKNNKWPFGHIPYGYIKNQKTKELEIFEEEKNIILRIVKNYLEDNMTLQAIRKSLENDQILPPSFSLKRQNEKMEEKLLNKNSIYFWHSTKIQRIFSNASMYTGVYQAFKKEYRKTGSKSILVSERAKQDWVEIKIPEILTVAQVNRINEKLESNRTFSKKRSVRSYMLQSKLFCNCENPVLHNFIGYFHNKKELRNYRCGLHNSTKYSEDRLCSNHISGLKIEPIVRDTLKELFLDPEYIFEKALDKIFPEIEANTSKDRYTELQLMLSDLEEKHKRNQELYLESAITKDRFYEFKKSLEEKETEYQNELEKEFNMMKSVSMKEVAKINMKNIFEETKEEMEDFFMNASYDELKEIINTVIHKVIVPKNKKDPVRIIMKIPGKILNFYEKYYEEDFTIYIDDEGIEHKIAPTGVLKPKLLKLDPSKKPLKYRTVEFMNDDNDSAELEEELKQNENRFLSYVKEKFHQLCKYDHFLNLKKQ